MAKTRTIASARKSERSDGYKAARKREIIRRGRIELCGSEAHPLGFLVAPPMSSLVRRPLKGAPPGCSEARLESCLAVNEGRTVGPWTRVR